MRRLPQSTAYTVMLKVFLSSDHVSAATGKTVAIKISKAGGAFADPNAGATNATEISNGWYKVTLDTTDTGTLGDLVVRGTSGSCDDSEQVAQVVKATNGGMTALPDAAAEAAGGLYTRGSGAGQINQDANGRIDVNLKAILGTLLTETAGQIAAGFKKLFDVASPVFTLTSVNQTGDAYARIGAAGAGLTALGDTRIAHLDADISSRLASGSYTAPDNAGITAIKAKTDNLPSDPADESLIIAATDSLASQISGLNNLSQSDIRNAVGLASANLDTQIATLATAAGLSDLSDGISASFTALQSHGDGAWVTATGFATSAALTTVSGNVDGIKAITDSLVMTAGKLWVLDDQGNPFRHSDEIASDFSTLSSHGDTAWATATGFAVPGDVPAASDNAAAVLAATYEGSETVQDHFRLARAALYGKANGLATTTAHYRDAADTKNRIAATVDADGNRSAVTTDAT